RPFGGYVVAEELGYVARGPRLAEIVSLDLVAFEIAKESQLLLGFHPFRHYAEPQAVRHGDDGPCDRCVVAVPRQVPNERAVDLEGVQGKALEVVQGRVARPEIVDREMYPECLELVEQHDRLFRILHHHAFGDLQLQERRVEAGLLEDPRYVREQALMVELTG